MCFRKISVVVVRTLERDKTRAQKYRKAFIVAVKIKIVAADIKRIRWILEIFRKTEKEGIYSCML